MRSGLLIPAAAFGLLLHLNPNANGGTPAQQVPAFASHYTCLTAPCESAPPSGDISAMSHPLGLRRFRMAVAATGEFTQMWGGKAQTRDALVELFDKVNDIFRKEAGVQLDLISGFDQMIFVDKDSDPFTTTEPSAPLIGEAQRAFDARLGSAAYDLGMLFTKGSYGIAYMRSVCDPSRKGASAVGFLTPVLDAFHINLVAHELGHQFGANHTFNSPTELCAQRRSAGSAYEPGAGSTIMSYAGLPCGGDVYQAVSDSYFHSESLREIQEFLKSPSAWCCLLEQIPNSPPTVTAGPTRVIPIGTPFTLRAHATDPDQNPLTFAWEQRDLGPAQGLGGPDNGLAPLVRSFPPSASPERTIPNLGDLLANRSNPAERLPMVSRSMKFRVVVRDGGINGAWASADTAVVVTNLGGAFEFTSHNEPGTIGQSAVLRWNVAGTTHPAIGAAEVRISMSTDGGLTFPIILAASTPNDGEETVELPRIECSTARFKIEPLNNIFFAINRANQAMQNAQLRITDIKTSANEVTLTWPSIIGKRYSVQRATGFPPTRWESVKRVEASSPSSTVQIPSENLPESYFRVVEE